MKRYLVGSGNYLTNVNFFIVHWALFEFDENDIPYLKNMAVKGGFILNFLENLISS